MHLPTQKSRTKTAEIVSVNVPNHFTDVDKIVPYIYRHIIYTERSSKANIIARYTGNF